MLNFKENEWEGNVTRVTTEPADPQEKEDVEAPDVIYYDKTAQCIGKFWGCSLVQVPGSSLSSQPGAAQIKLN